MNKLIMIDQKMRHRKVEINVDKLLYGFFSILLLIMTLITISASIREIHNHYGSNFINYDDFVLSDDIIDYAKKQNHNKTFSEQDID